MAAPRQFTVVATVALLALAMPWAATAADSTDPEVEAIVAKARPGLMRVVWTTEDARGRRTVHTQEVKDKAAARPVVARQLRDPDTLAVSMDQLRIATAVDDPQRGSQYALDMLQADVVYPINQGNAPTQAVVAVIDSGVSTHPDLAANLVAGYDAITNAPGGTTDGCGHGTHVAGIIAAVTDNGIGVASLAPQVDIMPIRVLQPAGAQCTGSTSNIAEGIYWAVDHGAHVLNLSLGGGEDANEQAAVQYAVSHDVAVVAASGNDGCPGPAQGFYPAAFPNVLGVAAIDSAQQVASFSSCGDWVDVAAPGVGIVSTCVGGGYCSMSGTSMATPYTAAAVALAVSECSISGAQAAVSVHAHVDDLGVEGRDENTGDGLIDPLETLQSGCSATPGIPGAFTSVVPDRLLDTRNGIGAEKQQVQGLDQVDFQVSGRGGVPDLGVGAVVLNVTVTKPAKGGYVTAFPTDEAPPTASNINFVAGQTIANHVTVKLNPDGRASLFNGSPGPVDLIADVAGWYAAGAATQPGMFTPMSPARLMNKSLAQSLETLPVAVTGQAGIPASGVGAGAFNVTVTEPMAAGYITAFPWNITMPNVSNLNFLPNQTIANAATVRLGQDGKIALFNGSEHSSRLIADVAGWFASGSPTLPGGYKPLDPARILDTRFGNGTPGGTPVRVGAKSSIRLTVAGRGGVPLIGNGGPAAAVLNVTVTRTEATGFITAYPRGEARPNSSNINFMAGQTIPNLVTVKLGSGAGEINLYNGSSQPVDLVADIAGWYRG